MALSYILQQVGYKCGLNPSVDGERAVLLRFVNTAAKELYHMSDMAGCLEEQCYKINSNQTIALPDYVGQIRAMREQYSHIALKLSQMRPRYNQFNWESEWRNWRLKGLYPLQTSLTNQSYLTISVKAVESTPVVVNISGTSDGSSNMFETVVMTSTTMTTVNEYNDITSFTKSAVNQYDVILSDADGNQISYIASDKLRALFQIVDISALPWYPPNINPLLGWVEVLYKKALPTFSNDTDEFPAPGYDEVIITKCLQLWAEEDKDANSAIQYYNKAQQMLAQIHEDTNRGTDDMVAMCEHPHDSFSISHRVGFGRDWKFAYRIIGR